MPPRSPGTPTGGALRRSVERRSVAPLVLLRRVPRWVPPVVALALLLTGLAAPPAVGVAALVVLASFLAWLAFLSWPAVGSFARSLRALAVLVLLALAALRLLGVSLRL